MKQGLTVQSAGGAGGGSVVVTPGPGQRSGKNWVAIAQMAQRTGGLAQQMATLERQLVAKMVPGPGPSPMHPFKIHRLPRALRVADADPAVDWRRVRVRAGRVLEADATGTDGYNEDPDAEIYVLDADEITVPADTAAFYFWLEIGSGGGGTTAVVRWHTDPTADSYDGGEDELVAAWGPTSVPWTTFPVMDAAHVLIGKVDTNTQKAIRYPIIRQYVRSDLVGIGAAGGVECPYG